MHWTTVGAGEAAAAVEGRVAGTLGPASALATTAGEAPAAGEALAAGEVLAAGELGSVASMAPGVEVPTVGVGLWRTRGQ